MHRGSGEHRENYETDEAEPIRDDRLREMLSIAIDEALKEAVAVGLQLGGGTIPHEGSQRPPRPQTR